MIVHISMRQLGKKRNTISAVPFELPYAPKSVRELITAAVQVCTADYNRRVRAGETNIHPMTQESLQNMETIGKLAFGVHYGSREADESSALHTALLGFEDGLYRIFCGQTELTGLDDALHLPEGAELTFVRLTMLTGTFF